MEKKHPKEKNREVIFYPLPAGETLSRIQASRNALKAVVQLNSIFFRNK